MPSAIKILHRSIAMLEAIRRRVSGSLSKPSNKLDIQDGIDAPQILLNRLTWVKLVTGKIPGTNGILIPALRVFSLKRKKYSG